MTELSLGVLPKTSSEAVLRSEIADLEVRVGELERKTTAKELARAVARYLLSVGDKE